MTCSEGFLMAVEEKVLEQKQLVDGMVDSLAVKGAKALEEFRSFSQEMIDEVVKEMAHVALKNHMPLAKMAVEETKRGVYEDKIFKNMFATEFIYNHIRHLKTVGVINENVHQGTVEIAEPVGVIAALVPVTNPTSTVIFKSMIAIKTRNPIIFAFHPLAQKCSSETARLMREAAIKAGAPKNCIQWIEIPTLDAIQTLMKHPKTSLILATVSMSPFSASMKTASR